MKLDLLPLEPVREYPFDKTDIPCVCGKSKCCNGDAECMMESTNAKLGVEPIMHIFVLDDGEYKEASAFTPHEIEIARRENRLFKKPRN